MATIQPIGLKCYRRWPVYRPCGYICFPKWPVFRPIGLQGLRTYTPTHT